MRALLGLLLLLAGHVLADSPAAAVQAALADCRRLPAEAQPHVRYLSLYHLDGADRKEMRQVLDFWLNSLSREGELASLHEAAAGLYRLDLRSYGLSRQVWDRLRDPYFTAQIKRQRSSQRWWPGGTWSDGQWYAAGWYEHTEEAQETALAPWLEARSAAQLAALTQSRVPVVRGDWWLVETAQQQGRQGTGYYDWLEVRDRQGFQRLVGLDQAAAERLHREIRAIVARSGVALNNRQIVRYQTITGSYWVTLDSARSIGGNNALRQLNGDYQHDAEEIYATLPNGLFAFFLGNAQGVRQDSAPDTIAADHQAPGNDRRVHVGVSCVRCHVEGIRPIDDWARRTYRPPVALASPDFAKLQRLRRLYLSDLERWLRRDQDDYAQVVRGLTGLTPLDLSRAFARRHADYQETAIGLARLAREAGVTPAVLLAVLKQHARVQGGLDPVLASLLHDQPESLRREHVEEVFALLMQIVRGHAP